MENCEVFVQQDGELTDSNGNVRHKVEVEAAHSDSREHDLGTKTFTKRQGSRNYAMISAALLATSLIMFVSMGETFHVRSTKIQPTSKMFKDAMIREEGRRLKQGGVAEHSLRTSSKTQQASAHSVASWPVPRYATQSQHLL